MTPSELIAATGELTCCGLEAPWPEACRDDGSGEWWCAPAPNAKVARRRVVDACLYLYPSDRHRASVALVRRLRRFKCGLPHDVLRDGAHDEQARSSRSLSYSGWESRRIASWRSVSPPSLTMSTRTPSSDARSPSNSTKSKIDASGANRTSRSRSLSTPSTPRATEPNTHTCTAWCRIAKARTCSRWRASSTEGRSVTNPSCRAGGTGSTVVSRLSGERSRPLMILGSPSW